MGALSRVRALSIGLVATLILVTGAGTSHAEPRPEAAPRDKRVFVIADSVGLSARTGFAAAFGSDWDVTLDGYPGVFVEQLETIVRRVPLETFGDTAVIAGGYDYPYWDPQRFDDSIDSIIRAFEERGVTKVFWVTLREVKPQYITKVAWRDIQPYYWYFPTANEHIRRAVERHSNLQLIDWAAIADRPGLTYDAIHLSQPFGVAEYTSLVSRIVKGATNRIPDGTITPIKVAGTGGVPGDAAAVALNLAVTGTRRGGFLTAYPCGEPLPLAANLNYVADETVSAAAIVPVGADGRVCIYNSAATQLIVDVMGSFPAGGAFVRAGPTRLTDTRAFSAPITGGTELRVDLPAGLASVSAAVLNITAIGGDQSGFVTAYGCGDPPPATSNVNFAAGSITPNLAVVRPDASGAVCLRPNQSAHLVVDLFGAFNGDALLLPGATRALDTRSGPAATSGSTVTAPTGATATAGVLVNVTAVGAGATGFLSAHPCDAPRPPTANLNVSTGQTRGNFALVKPDPGGNVCVFTNVATDVVVDVMGSMTKDFTGLTTPVRAFDSR